MAELLHEESRGRFARHAGLPSSPTRRWRRSSRDSLPRFGGELPTELRRAFPGFAAAMREAWQPIQERRGLLLWLTQRG